MFGQAYWIARIRKGSFVRRIIGRSASRRGLLGWMLLNASRARFLFKKGLECGIFGSFLALCRRTCGYVCADGSLTWGNRRCQLRRRLGLRNYATFEGAFEHAHASHGKIQWLLARWLRRARRGRGRRARTLEGMRVEVPRSTRNRIRRWTGWPLRKRACMR